MLLVSFSHRDHVRVGVLDRPRNEIVDLSQTASELPRDMISFIAAGTKALQAARAAVAGGKGRIKSASAKIIAPIPRPARNIICVGKNYREHAKEVQATAFASADKDGVPPLPV